MEMSVEHIRLKLAERLTLARGTDEFTDLIHVEIIHNGCRGRGEGAPIGRYDEMPQSAVAFLEHNSRLLGTDPFAIEQIGNRLAKVGPNQRAARSAVINALYDLCGRSVRLPVWRLLGLSRVGPPTMHTISLGDPDTMARKAEQLTRHFKLLKLKLGGVDGLDIDRVRAVRSTTHLPLVVDVNEFWSFDDALEYLPQLSMFGVVYCEQPLMAGHMDAPALKRRSPIPIFLDEECITPTDILAARDRAHGVNIKLCKVGGLREALKMIDMARGVGLQVTIGCMNNSGLGIAAACQVASLCDYADLDGNLLLADDPCPGVELHDGVQVPPDAPGILPG